MNLIIRKLSSGSYRIEEDAPHGEWLQVPEWPCHEDVVHANASAHATFDFFGAVIREAYRLERAGKGEG